MQGSRQHFGPRLGPSLAILEASALLLGARLAGGHVEAKSGYVMMLKPYIYIYIYISDFVRPCCLFCIQKCPSSRTMILSGFL